MGFDVTVSKTVPPSCAVLSIEITSETFGGKWLCAKIQTSTGLGFEHCKTWVTYKNDFNKVSNSDDDDGAHTA